MSGFEVVQFLPRHIEMLARQPSQTYAGQAITVEQGKIVAKAGPAYSAFDNGKIVGCAGFVRQWEGRATAWGLFSECGPATFLKIHRAIAAALDRIDIRRVEATVDHEFEAAHRWMRLLGFQLETPNGMKGWSPNGQTFDLYARVR